MNQKIILLQSDVDNEDFCYPIYDIVELLEFYGVERDNISPNMMMSYLLTTHLSNFEFG